MTGRVKEIRCLRDESGYSIILVLVLMLIGLAILTASLAAAISSEGSSARGARVRRAQQAADAGIEAQLYDATQADLGSSSYNLNGGALGTSALLDCIVPQVSLGVVIGVYQTYANTAGVCPEAWSGGATGKSASLTQAVGDNSAYQSEFIPGGTEPFGGGETQLSPRIVSIGSETSNVPSGSHTVYSREEAILAPVAPIQAIEGENSVTIGGLQLCLPLLGCSSIASVLNGDVLARGNLTTPSLALLGLNLSSGLIAKLSYSGTLSGGAAIANEQNVTQSSIVERSPLSIATKPDCSVASNCTALGSAYNSAYDTFSMSGGSVTFQPGDYVFCSFNATGGTVTVSPTSSTSGPVRIFIDSPSSSRCAGDKAHGDSHLGDFNDPAGMNNTLVSATLGALAASGVQVYVVGDGSYDDDTTVQIGPTTTTGLLSLSALTYAAIVYAPTSKVTVNVPAACITSLLCSGGVFEGAVVGNDTTVDALTVTQDLDLGNFPLYSGINAFHVAQYIQCDDSVTSLTGSTSDESGC